MTEGRKEPTPPPLDQVKPEPPPAPPPKEADHERRSGIDRRLPRPLPDYVCNVNEGQRQIIVLALAKLSLERPGWYRTIGEISDQFGGVQGRALLEDFRKIHKEGRG